MDILDTDIYKCLRCGYQTEKIANLKNHFKRKNVCRDVLNCGKSIDTLLGEMTGTLSFPCDCGQCFATKQGLHQHKRLCTSSDNPIIQKILEENKKLKIELENALKAKEGVSNSTTINNNTTINSNIVNNNITNNITIVCDFGNEDMSYVLDDKEFLEGCMKKLYTSAIESVIKKIYFEDTHPENHSIKMQNIKQNQVMIKENSEWMRRHISGPACIMIHKGKSILQTYYNGSGEAQRALDKMVEENDLVSDKKLDYLNKLGRPETNEHKVAVSKVKGVISNFKFKASDNLLLPQCV